MPTLKKRVDVLEERADKTEGRVKDLERWRLDMTELREIDAKRIKLIEDTDKARQELLEQEEKVLRRLAENDGK